MLQHVQKCCYIATNRVFSHFDATKCYNAATLFFILNRLIINDAHNATHVTYVFYVLSSIIFDYTRKKASDWCRTPQTTN